MVGIAGDAEITLPAAGDPVVLEPRDMAGFPQRRVELHGIGHDQGLAQRRNVGVEQDQGPGAAVAQGKRERLTAAAARDTCRFEIHVRIGHHG